MVDFLGMGSCAIVILHFRDRSDTLEVAGKSGLRQRGDVGQGRDIPADSAPVVRLMLGKFTLAGHPFFSHWTQEPMPSKIRLTGTSLKFEMQIPTMPLNSEKNHLFRKSETRNPTSA